MAFSAFLIMRPLHRPLHDKFIFYDKWDSMSEKERLEAIRDGKVRVPRTRHEFQSLKQSEIEELRQKIRPYFDEIKKSILSLLEQMPKSLLLICRYI